MEIRKVLVLRGPNYWANFPVLEAWVDLGELKDSPSDELPGFNERLMAWLPTMIEHRCNVGERGGFFERLRRGTYQAHILEHVALELQSLAGTDVGSSSAAKTVTVTNAGTSAASVSGVAVTGDFSQTNNCASIAVNGSCTVTVTFKPTASGTRTGTLTVTSNANNSPTTATLSGSGA